MSNKQKNVFFFFAIAIPSALGPVFITADANAGVPCQQNKFSQNVIHHWIPNFMVTEN